VDEQTSHAGEPDVDPEAAIPNAQERATVGAGRAVHVMVDFRPHPYRWALVRTFRDSLGGLFLSLLPLLMLAFGALFPTVGQIAAARVSPLVALALLLPLQMWDIVRLARGRPPRVLFPRHNHSDWHPDSVWRARVTLFVVTIACLPALIILAVGSTMHGVLMACLVVLPVFLFFVIVLTRAVLRGLSTPGGLARYPSHELAPTGALERPDRA
jgi:hypothetical protein